MKTYIEKLRAFGFETSQTVSVDADTYVFFERADGWKIIQADETWSLHHNDEHVIETPKLKTILDALPLSWASEVAKHDPDLVGTVLQELMPQYTRTVH